MLRFGPLGRAAHLCVDMQRMFAEPTDWHTPWLPRVLPKVVQLVEHAPQSAIFTRFIPLHHASEGRGTWRRYYQRWPSMTRENLPREMLELVPELKHFAPPAAVLDKGVYSPWGSGLAMSLRSRGINTVIVSGAETEVCVLATVLGAVDEGFRVVVVSDALCSSADETHDAVMRIYESRFGMQIECAQTDEVVVAWT